jgi:hypothetical protein
MSIHDRISPMLRCAARSLAVIGLLGATGALSTAHARVLDFGAALQDLEAGEDVRKVEADGGTMWISVHNDGEGPDKAIVFDSSDPCEKYEEIGTPNEDFGGPGEGKGGEEGSDYENDRGLGNVLVVAEDDADDDLDGHVDVPKDEDDGGTVWLKFSHAGRLSFSVVDVDEDEEAPRVFLYHEGDFVDVVELANGGDNSLQEVDLSSFGDIDAVKIKLAGTAAIGDIQMEVLQVGVEAQTWSQVKRFFR